MSKISSAVDYILKELEQLFPVNHLYTGKDICKIDERLSPKDIEAYMLPATDILEPNQEKPNGYSVYLGTYTAMSSPGIVTLCLDNLKDFFHSLVKRSLHKGHNISTQELKSIAKLVVYKTYWHEIFHFDCNVLRCLFGGYISRNIEEALAVARSRMRVVWEKDYKFWEINTPLFEFILYEAYQYKSPGYKDWVKYADIINFKEGLLGYINPPKSSLLRSNGVQIQEYIYSLLTPNNGKEGEGFIIQNNYGNDCCS